MTESTGRAARRERLAQRYERLAQSRAQRPVSAILGRFNDIDGSNLGLLISLELFTTVIPLIIIGFSYVAGFSDSANPGSLFSRELGLESPLSDRFREAFGESASLASTWTFLGVAGFLIWGVPMSITIAGMFAQAWRREQFGRWHRLWRGGIWFLLYLTMIGLREQINAVGADRGAAIAVLFFLISTIPVWVFWSLSPVLLVRDGGRGLKYLGIAGLAGWVIDGLLIPVAARIVFPPLLAGWTAFGPIGVAMALLMWCGVIGVGWVVTACTTAVLWERTAPAETVVESQSAEDAIAS